MNHLISLCRKRMPFNVLAAVAFFFIASHSAFAQQWLGGSTSTSNIYRTGNIGIGLTTAPIARVEIIGAPVFQFRLRGTGSPNYWNIFHNASSTADYGLVFGGSDGNAYLVLKDVSAGGHSSFPTGNLGIGTRAPQAKLDIVGATPNQLRLQGSGSTNRWLLFHNANSLNDYGFTFADNGGNRFIVNDRGNSSFPTGNLGIGTTTPATPLHLYSSNNPTIMRIQSSATFGAGRIEFWSDPRNSTYEWRPGYIQSTDNGNFTGGLAFFVNGSGVTNKTNFVETMRIVNGNVGIGTVNPKNRLHVAGDIVAGKDVNGQKFIFHTRSHINGDFLQITNDDGAGNWEWHKGITFVRSTGNVGIETTNPTHKLSVNGTIRAKEVIVNTGWSDFVFHDDYKLMPLHEVERYIQANGHLPDVPTEAEVKAEGVSLGEMQAKLLQKIEELTLYVIELKKENTALANKLMQRRARHE